MSINSKIFKAYDVRGIYPEEINEEAAQKIGWAFVEFLKNKGELPRRKIVIGRDARPSSDSLSDALSQGIISQSVDLIDLGYVSTPFFYWVLIKKEADGGIMITASHNPAQYNGFKICSRQARPIGLENGLIFIKELAEKSQVSVSLQPGKRTQENLLQDYLDFILGQIDLTKIKPLKIVVDAGNGMIGPEIEQMAKKLPGQIEILFGQPDGNFPNHEANPSKPETLTALKEKVLAEKADLGIAFDGDADRVAFLDEQGQIIRGDFITVLIAQDLLKQNPKQKIFYEVRSSWIVPEMIKKGGGMPILGRPGHALIKEQMRRENIFFSGELSGHYFFKTLGYLDNALLAMLKVLEILSQAGRPFSELIKPFQKYFQSGEINFSAEDKERILDRVEQKYTDAKNIFKLDGLTVEYDDWWFNLRPSNTEPLLRLNLEAKTKKLMKEKIEEIKKLIK